MFRNWLGCGHRLEAPPLTPKCTFVWSRSGETVPQDQGRKVRWKKQAIQVPIVSQLAACYLLTRTLIGFSQESTSWCEATTACGPVTCHYSTTIPARSPPSLPIKPSDLPDYPACSLSLYLKMRRISKRMLECKRTTTISNSAVYVGNSAPIGSCAAHAYRVDHPIG